jgi:hypothetical protein
VFRSTASLSLPSPASAGPARIPAYRRLSPLTLCALLTASLLAACAQPGQIAAKSAKEKKAIAAARASGTNQTPAAPGAEAAATAAPAGTWQSADKLMGLGSEDLRAALGAPARIRDEDPARIYQYIGGDCVLDLFLYQAEGTYRVTYAEARSVKAEKKPIEACLKSLPSPIVAANTQPST